MTDEEIDLAQAFLQKKLGTEAITLNRSARRDMAEVLAEGETVGTLTRDEDEGEVSYHFVMVILDFELYEDENAAG